MTKAIATKATYNYLGQDRKGLLRLRSDKEALLVSGTLYAASTPKKPAAEKTKVALVALKTSPSYATADSDQRFTVITNTGEKLRVVGKVVARELVTNITRQLGWPAPRTAEGSEATTQATAKKIRGGKKPSGDALLNEEIVRVNALLKLGHDPEVRMKYVSHFIGQSEGNLYKKIKALTFPAPYTKPGGGAHWKHSTLLEYQAQTAEPNARSGKKKV
jgi:predicted DNA-binding transcriptional regulator AlpA